MQESTIQIVPMDPSEAPDFINIYCLAFSDPAADIIMPMVYPIPLQHPQIRQRFLAGFEPPSPTNKCYLAKDPKTGNVVGCSRWTLISPSNAARADLKTEIGRVWTEKSHNIPSIPGTNEALEKAYFSAAFAAKWDLPRPFVELKMLAVHPEHQGRGIGSMLVRDGLKWVDEMGVPCFVVSAKQGRPVYERYGFDEARDFPLDAREYGGEREGKHWSMLRGAKK